MDGRLSQTKWDTANVYSNGVSEEIIGKAIKKYNLPRHKLLILSKCCGTVRESNDPETLALKDIESTVDYVNQRGTETLENRSTPIDLGANIHRTFPTSHIQRRRRISCSTPDPLHRPLTNPSL